MSLQPLADAYARVRSAGNFELPAMAPARLAVEPRTIDDAAGGWAALAALGPLAGWLQFQSHICCFAAGTLPEPQSDWGVLLAAEACDTAGRSYQVRQDGDGGLLLVTATPGTADGPGTRHCLTDEVRHLATARAPGPLRYRRYWARDPDMGLVPVFAAFEGFDRTEVR